MGLRTFMALEIDEPTRDAMVQIEPSLDTGGAKIKWVERDNLHVTLNFLGDVPDEQLAEVCEVAAAVAGEVDPFDFEIVGAVCVPPAGRQLRMIWANVVEPTGALSGLYEKLAVGLEGLALRREQRAFKPHITLARVKFAPRPDVLRGSMEPWRQTAFGLQHADELTVFSSHLTSDGPIYAPIAKPPLGV